MTPDVNYWLGVLGSGWTYKTASALAKADMPTEGYAGYVGTELEVLRAFMLGATHDIACCANIMPRGS